MKSIFLPSISQLDNDTYFPGRSCQNRVLQLALVIVLGSTIGCTESAPHDAQPEGQSDSNKNSPSHILSVPEESSEEKPAANATQTLQDKKTTVFFRDVTQEVGLPLKNEPWPDGKYYTPEITAGGVGLLDYDNDGLLDIYLVCHAPSQAPPAPFGGHSPNRLFQQQADGSFQEVADAAGMNDPGFGHSVATGDIDNDGDLDVFVTNYGSNRLYLNDGTGKFTDITLEAGLEDELWSSAASFFDYDRDGDLDLIVINFATFDYKKRCSPSGRDDDLDYCGPHEFPGLLDTLYRNNGDGTFTDVTEELGIDTPARGWGVITADMTGDGIADIYVANDEEPNQLWVQQEDGTFLDEAVWRGCAFNNAGKVEASMGVTYGDINADSKMDLFMTHVTLETNTLYVSGGDDSVYDDASAQSGMGSNDRSYTGWGCGFFDFDHDGDLDLAVANGRVAKGAVSNDSLLGDFWSHYGEQNFLFQNDGKGHFSDIANRGEKFTSTIEVTRGLAFGDIDNDGDVDMVSNSISNTLRVYRNVAPKEDTHWLTVRAITNNRDAVGAMITLNGVSGRNTGVVLVSYSYLASNDPRVHFGLGNTSEIKSLSVNWPDGSRERFEVPSVDQHLVVVQGQGMAISP